MYAPNPLRKFAESALRYPSWIGLRLMTWVFRYKVKLVGTAKIDILQSDLKSVTFLIKNRKRVRNHIGSVHAAAMALLAESATGFLVGVNLPGDKSPLIKSMNLKYVRRSSGNIKAFAWLSDEQIVKMQSEPKGDVLVSVTVTDESGQEPVICEMNWAWINKK